MPYFSEVSDYKTYAGQIGDFHFSYNGNSGGGQSFLGGKFRNENGNVESASVLNGRIGVFQFRITDADGVSRRVSLEDEETKYEIKPRASGDNNMKLGVDGKKTPSAAIAAFLMLPKPCGVKRADHVDISPLCSKNYWLQSMWMSVDKTSPQIATLIPQDCVFSGGVNRNGSGRLRHFKVDFARRMSDIIAVAKSSNLDREILDCVGWFADVYEGRKNFNCDDAISAIENVMKHLQGKYPDRYSGLMDPLPVITELADLKAEKPRIKGVDRLTIALKCFELARAKIKAPAGWNNFDEWAKAARVAFAGVDETKVTDPHFDYAQFMRQFAISVQVANTKFSGHTQEEQVAVLKFLREQRDNPQIITWYLSGTHRPQVNGADVNGMGVTTTLFFLMEIHPDLFASWSGMTYDSLSKVGLHDGPAPANLTLQTYDGCKSKQCQILVKMNEMGIGKASDDSSDADYITVNEFLWFVAEQYDLIMQEWSKHMKHEIKLTNQTAVTENDFAAFIKKFIDAAKDAGLTYDDNLIKRFVCALLAKPFVVLTGLSGSGKTKLAQIFTQWIATQDMYRIVPVGADWTNSEKLLGYPNALDPNNYILPDTGVLKLMIDANDNPTVPFFLILDEMNLSHVERYFADFLSAMESEGSIKLYDGKNRMADDGTPVPPTIPFPKNLFVIGTMNVDETTHAFSPKVLDRAQVIEFRVSEKQINDFLDNPTNPDLAKIEGKGVEYAAAFLGLHDKPIELSDTDKAKVNAPLKNFFPVLAELSSEFAFRTASEALKFCGFALKSVMSEEETVDAAIMQKLLPKLHGSRRRLAAPLEAFWGFCRKDDKTQTIADVCKKDSTDKVSDVAKFPVSAEKIRRLYKAAEQNGFASYAEA